MLFLQGNNFNEQRLALTSIADSKCFPFPAFWNPLDRSYGQYNLNGLGASQAAPEKLSVSSYALNAQFFAFCPSLNKMTDGASQTIWLTEHYAWNCNGVTFRYDLGLAQPWKPFQPATFAHGGKVAGRPAPEDYYPITNGNPLQTTAADGNLSGGTER